MASQHRTLFPRTRPTSHISPQQIKRPDAPSKWHSACFVQLETEAFRFAAEPYRGRTVTDLHATRETAINSTDCPLFKTHRSGGNDPGARLSSCLRGALSSSLLPVAAHGLALGWKYPRCRGCRAGSVPASVSRRSQLRWRFSPLNVAVSHFDQYLSRSAPSANATPRASGARNWTRIDGKAMGGDGRS